MPQKSNNKPFVIGVAGGSGSGKSTVTREVLASIGPGMASVVYQDDYYCDQTHLAPEERVKTNYDHPDAFDWPLLVQHVQALRRGDAIVGQEPFFAGLHEMRDVKQGPDGLLYVLTDESEWDGPSRSDRANCCPPEASTRKTA